MAPRRDLARAPEPGSSAVVWTAPMAPSGLPLRALRRAGIGQERPARPDSRHADSPTAASEEGSTTTGRGASPKLPAAAEKNWLAEGTASVGVLPRPELRRRRPKASLRLPGRGGRGSA